MDKNNDSHVPEDLPQIETGNSLMHQPSGIVIPTPPTQSLSNATVFINVILFICLYILAASIGSIFHIAIERLIPYAEGTSPGFWASFNSYNAIIISFAAIFVSFPLFIKLGLAFKKETIKNPLLKTQKFLKTLGYITLAGTFLFMVGHVIFTFNEFLNPSNSLIL